LIKREIEKRHPEVKMKGNSKAAQQDESHSAAKTLENNHTENSEEQPENAETPKKTYGINAILIDFFLYDTMKNLEAEHNETIPHHRTRSIWY
jgi:hypothetical protein